LCDEEGDYQKKPESVVSAVVEAVPVAAAAVVEQVQVPTVAVPTTKRALSGTLEERRVKTYERTISSMLNRMDELCDRGGLSAIEASLIEQLVGTIERMRQHLS
jgi:hypothetical protein